MPDEYRISRQARRDLDGIWLHTAETHSPDQADRYDESMHAAFRRLAAFPTLGRAVPDRPDGLRSLMEGSHVVLYQPEPAPMIVRVLHQRQDWMSVLSDG